MKNNFELKEAFVETKESIEEKKPRNIISDMEAGINGYFHENNLEKEVAISEMTNKKFGDITFNTSEFSQEFDHGELLNYIQDEFGPYITSVQEIEGHVNIVFDKKMIASEVVNKNILRKSLLLHRGKNYEVEFGHLNLDKPQKVGQLRNFFTGRGINNMLKLAGANIKTNVIINDVGMKASKLFYAAINNWSEFESISQKNGYEYYEGLKALFKKIDEEENAEEEIKILNATLSKQLQGNKAIENNELMHKVNAITGKSLNEMKVLWKDLGIIVDGINLQSKYEKKTDNKTELMEKGLFSNLFYQKDELVFVNTDEIGLGQHVLVKKDGTDTYIIKDLVSLIDRLSDIKNDKEYICVGPSLFDHYNVVKYILNKLYPELISRMKIIYHQLSHTDKDTNTNLYSFLDKINQKINIKKENNEIAEKDIIRTNLIYQNVINNLNSHVNINIEKFIQNKGDSGTYILYTINRFDKLFSLLYNDAPDITKGSIKIEDIPELSSSENDLLTKFLFLRKTLDRAINIENPAHIYREFMSLGKLLNSCYHEIPKLRRMVAENKIEEIKARVVILKKLFDEYKYIFSILFS